MARLVLINGAPASGKSTIAAALADESPLTLVLDIDSVRGSLGRWSDDPTAAGLAARRLALAMIREHLGAGHDVIVPQFLKAPEFADALVDAARSAGAGYVEIVLLSDPADAAARFEARAGSADRNHRDAAELQRRSTAEPIEKLYSDMTAMIGRRPFAHRVRTVEGRPEQAVAAVRAILAAS
jgi:predicted kinase